MSHVRCGELLRSYGAPPHCTRHLRAAYSLPAFAGALSAHEAEELAGLGVPVRAVVVGDLALGPAMPTGASYGWRGGARPGPWGPGPGCR